MLENCKNVSPLFHGPCKHSGWYTNEVVFCDLFRIKVKHDRKLRSGLGEFRSQFPKECPHSLIVDPEIKDEEYWTKMFRIEKLQEMKGTSYRRK